MGDDKEALPSGLGSFLEEARNKFQDPSQLDVINKLMKMLENKSKANPEKSTDTQCTVEKTDKSQTESTQNNKVGPKPNSRSEPKVLKKIPRSKSSDDKTHSDDRDSSDGGLDSKESSNNKICTRGSNPRSESLERGKRSTRVQNRRPVSQRQLRSSRSASENNELENDETIALSGHVVVKKTTDPEQATKNIVSPRRAGRTRISQLKEEGKKDRTLNPEEKSESVSSVDSGCVSSCDDGKGQASTGKQVKSQTEELVKVACSASVTNNRGSHNSPASRSAIINLGIITGGGLSSSTDNNQDNCKVDLMDRTDLYNNGNMSDSQERGQKKCGDSNKEVMKENPKLNKNNVRLPPADIRPKDAEFTCTAIPVPLIEFEGTDDKIKGLNLKSGAGSKSESNQLQIKGIRKLNKNLTRATSNVEEKCLLSLNTKGDTNALNINDVKKERIIFNCKKAENFVDSKKNDPPKGDNVKSRNKLRNPTFPIKEEALSNGEEENPASEGTPDPNRKTLVKSEPSTDNKVSVEQEFVPKSKEDISVGQRSPIIPSLNPPLEDKKMPKHDLMESRSNEKEVSLSKSDDGTPLIQAESPSNNRQAKNKDSSLPGLPSSKILLETTKAVRPESYKNGDISRDKGCVSQLQIKEINKLNKNLTRATSNFEEKCLLSLNTKGDINALNTNAVVKKERIIFNSKKAENFVGSQKNDTSSVVNSAVSLSSKGEPVNSEIKMNNSQQVEKSLSSVDMSKNNKDFVPHEFNENVSKKNTRAQTTKCEEEKRESVLEMIREKEKKQKEQHLSQKKRVASPLTKNVSVPDSKGSNSFEANTEDPVLLSKKLLNLEKPSCHTNGSVPIHHKNDDKSEVRESNLEHEESPKKLPDKITVPIHHQIDNKSEVRESNLEREESPKKLPDKITVPVHHQNDNKSEERESNLECEESPKELPDKIIQVSDAFKIVPREPKFTSPSKNQEPIEGCQQMAQKVNKDRADTLLKISNKLTNVHDGVKDFCDLKDVKESDSLSDGNNNGQELQTKKPSKNKVKINFSKIKTANKSESVTLNNIDKLNKLEEDQNSSVLKNRKGVSSKDIKEQSKTKVLSRNNANDTKDLSKSDNIESPVQTVNEKTKLSGNIDQNMTTVSLTEEIVEPLKISDRTCENNSASLKEANVIKDCKKINKVAESDVKIGSKFENNNKPVDEVGVPMNPAKAVHVKEANIEIIKERNFPKDDKIETKRRKLGIDETKLTIKPDQKTSLNSLTGSSSTEKIVNTAVDKCDNTISGSKISDLKQQMPFNKPVITNTNIVPGTQASEKSQPKSLPRESTKATTSVKLRQPPCETDVKKDSTTANCKSLRKKIVFDLDNKSPTKNEKATEEPKKLRLLINGIAWNRQSEKNIRQTFDSNNKEGDKKTLDNSNPILTHSTNGLLKGAIEPKSLSSQKSTSKVNYFEGASSLFPEIKLGKHDSTEKLNPAPEQISIRYNENSEVVTGREPVNSLPISSRITSVNPRLDRMGNQLITKHCDISPMIDYEEALESPNETGADDSTGLGDPLVDQVESPKSTEIAIANDGNGKSNISPSKSFLEPFYEEDEDLDYEREDKDSDCPSFNTHMDYYVNTEDDGLYVDNYKEKKETDEYSISEMDEVQTGGNYDKISSAEISEIFSDEFDDANIRSPSCRSYLTLTVDKDELKSDEDEGSYNNEVHGLSSLSEEDDSVNYTRRWLKSQPDEYERYDLNSTNPYLDLGEERSVGPIHQIPMIESYDKNEPLHGILCPTEFFERLEEIEPKRSKTDEFIQGKYFSFPIHVGKKLLTPYCQNYIMNNGCFLRQCNKLHKVDHNWCNLVKRDDTWEVLKYVLIYSQKVPIPLMHQAMVWLKSLNDKERLLEMCYYMAEFSTNDDDYLNSVWSMLVEVFLGFGLSGAIVREMIYNALVPEEITDRTLSPEQIVSALGRAFLYDDDSTRSFWKVLKKLSKIDGFEIPPMAVNRIMYEIINAADPDFDLIFEFCDFLETRDSDYLSGLDQTTSQDFSNFLKAHKLFQFVNKLDMCLRPSSPAETNLYLKRKQSSPTKENVKKICITRPSISEEVMAPNLLEDSDVSSSLKRSDPDEVSSMRQIDLAKTEAGLKRALDAKNHVAVLNILNQHVSTQHADKLALNLCNLLANYSTHSTFQHLLVTFHNGELSNNTPLLELITSIGITIAFSFVKECNWNAAAGFLHLLTHFNMPIFKVKELVDGYSQLRIGIVICEIFIHSREFATTLKILRDNSLFNPASRSWKLRGITGERSLVICTVGMFLLRLREEGDIDTLRKTYCEIVAAQKSLSKPIDVRKFLQPLILELLKVGRNLLALDVYDVSKEFKENLNLAGNVVRALLCLAYREKNVRLQRDLFFRGTTISLYPIVGADSNQTIVIYSYWLPEEILANINEWFLNYAQTILDTNCPTTGHIISLRIEVGVAQEDPKIASLNVDNSLDVAMVRVQKMLGVVVPALFIASIYENKIVLTEKSSQSFIEKKIEEIEEE